MLLPKELISLHIKTEYFIKAWAETKHLVHVSFPANQIYQPYRDAMRVSYILGEQYDTITREDITRKCPSYAIRYVMAADVAATSQKLEINDLLTIVFDGDKPKINLDFIRIIDLVNEEDQHKEALVAECIRDVNHGRSNAINDGVLEGYELVLEILDLGGLVDA